MGIIKGIDVVLYEKVETGVDKFNKPIYENKKTIVKDVLVSPVTTIDITNELSLTGKQVSYMLCIPKGDTHSWLNTKVEFFGKTFTTFGFDTKYIEKNVPLKWNRKVYCELYG